MRNHINKTLITEGVETKNMSAAKHYLYDNYNYTESQAMELIGAVKHDIPNVRLQKCKFILGVVRMWKNNQLSDADTILKFNRTLRLLASNTHVNEYDQNLNGLSADEIIDKFALVLQKEIDDNKDELSKMEFVENDKYTIVPINSFDDAYEYHMWTDWCVANDESSYNTYTSGDINKFYFCLIDGFEDIHEEKSNGCPLDEYGLSMIAVSVTDQGACNTVTCRWNHTNGGNDNVMSEAQLSEIIGRNFYDVFKPYSEEELKERKKKLVKELARIISEFDEYTWAVVLDTRNCETIMPKEQADIRRENAEGSALDSLIDDDNYSSWDDDEYYDDNEFVRDNAFGYIICTDLDDSLVDIAGEGKYIIIDDQFEPMCDNVFDNAYLMDENFDNPNDVYILVTNGKRFNVYNFGKQSYVFSEWFTIAPTILSVNDSKFYFLVNHVYTKQLFDSNGKSIGPKCKEIQIYARSQTAFITIDNVTNYMNWITGDIYVENIVRHKRVQELEAIMTDDESIHLYGPAKSEGAKRRLYKLSNIPLVSFASLHGWHSNSACQGYGYDIIGKNVGHCYVDVHNRKTYDAAGNLIDECDE